ncbi:major tail protein [Escherichia phage Ioannina]|nr:major tail protein [Escherichia phage Ioannina]
MVRRHRPKTLPLVYGVRPPKIFVRQLHYGLITYRSLPFSLTAQRSGAPVLTAHTASTTACWNGYLKCTASKMRSELLKISS